MSGAARADRIPPGVGVQQNPLSPYNPRERILLTHDQDFLDDRRFPPHRNAGVIVLPGGSGSAKGLASALRSVVSIIGPNRGAFRFKIEITKDGIWNIKSLLRVSDEAQNWRLHFGQDDKVYEWENQ